MKAASTNVSDACPKCGHETLRQHVNVFVEADVSCRNLSKKGIRSERVKVLGVGWDRATWFCSRSACSYLVRLDAHAWRNGDRVRLRSPKRGQVKTIGTVRGRPAGFRARALYVAWPGGWSGHVRVDEVELVEAKP